MTTAPRCWIAVASAEHARGGRDQGFIQVCHGKAAPLRRLRVGDVVTCYAPNESMGGKDGLQSFVSMGEVQAGDPYAFDMGGGFVPFRRDVRYWAAQSAPIRPLLDGLRFIEDRQRWGYKFRFGLFEIPAADMRLIARAMGVENAAWKSGEVSPPAASESTTLPLF